MIPPPIDDKFALELAAQIARLFDGYRDDLPETLWFASLAMIDKATERTRNWHWWRSHPAGELRRLRDRLAPALALARMAAALQEADNGVDRDLARELREAAAASGKARRRAQTLPAQEARLAKARRRKLEDGSTLSTEEVLDGDR